MHDSTQSMEAETRNASRRHPARRMADIVISVLFCAILVLPLLATCFSDNGEEIARLEQRFAAEFPKLDYLPRFGGLIYTPAKHSVKEFPRRFEKWFNDHLGFRRRFIQLFALARVTGLTPQQFGQLTVGKEPKSGAIIGREGQLFYCVDARIWGDYRRTTPLSQDELALWRRIFEERGRWLARRGIPYIVFISPNAYTIYPEFMPRSVMPPNLPSSFDRLIPELQSLENVHLVDPRAALLAAKPTRRTYYKADSRWNNYGAYIAYRELMQRIAETYPEAMPWEVDRFSIEEADCLSEGDLARMVDSPLPVYDTRVTLTPRQPRQASFVKLPSQGDEVKREVSSNPSAPLRSALVLHDCFFSSVMPYFGEHFQTVHYEGLDPIRFPVELIERLQPTVVVQQMVERRLVGARPENPSIIRIESQKQWANRPGDARR